METNNELQNSSESAEIETPLEELALPESVENDVEAENAKLREANAKLYARTKKAEEKLKQGKPVAETPKSETTADPIEALLKLKADGFTDAEVLDLRAQARTLNVDVNTLLANPIFKAGMESKRQKAQIEQATPNPSGRSFVHGNKTWAEVAATGTPAEQKQFLAEMQAKGK
jgi:hypothetical protein